MNERDPMALADALDGVVRSLQGGVRRTPGAAQAMGGVFGRWEEIVGDHVAAHVRPIRLDGAGLVVEVDDPAWATQVRLLSERLRTRIHDVTATTVDSIEVRVAGRRR